MPQSPETQAALTAQSVGARYSTLLSIRRPYVERAWDCAELTIPAILPRDGNSASQVFNTPWSSAGAQAVNSLAAKVLMITLPPNTPVFRLRIDEILLAQEQVQAEQKSKFDAGLSKIEKAVMADIEMSGDRAGVAEAIKHLIVVGNILLFDSKAGLRIYTLNNYVVRRDPSGNPLEIIAVEQVDQVVVPQAVRDTIQSEDSEKLKGDKPLDVYTHVKRTDQEWDVYQEVCGVKIPGTDGTYKLDESPWLALRFTRVDGEDYGRSYVEEYLGDFRSLEDLSQALTEGAKAAAKTLIMVNPNGTTRMKTIAEAENGAVISGNKEEVGVLQMDKFHDFQTAERQARVIEGRIAMAFLMNTAIQRQAERVTAEEIRFMAQELETTLGGFYTIFSQEFQLPYIKGKMARMQRANRLPQLPKGVVRPFIVTGIEALGRGNDRVKLVAYLRALTETIGPEATAQIVNVSEVATRLATADGIDETNLIRTQAQIDAQNQQAQIQQLVEKLGPNAVNAAGGVAKQVTSNLGTQSQQGRSGNTA